MSEKMNQDEERFRGAITGVLLILFTSFFLPKEILLAFVIGLFVGLHVDYFDLNYVKKKIKEGVNKK